MIYMPKEKRSSIILYFEQVNISLGTRPFYFVPPEKKGGDIFAFKFICFSSANCILNLQADFTAPVRRPYCHL